MKPPRTRSRTGARQTLQALASALCGLFVVGCSSSPEQSAIEHGQQLFESKALSSSSLNDYSCASCHDATPGQTLIKKTGAALAGATLRTQFWGGQEGDLLRSLNACRNYFMVDNEPLSASDRDARALYAYLQSLEPGDDSPQPFTVVTTIELLPRGNQAQGAALFAEACQACHGSIHVGEGRLSERVPVIPEDTLAEPQHAGFTPRLQRIVFTEKIRHGLFLGYGGEMPPFSAELLSDSDVSDILEALGVLGE